MISFDIILLNYKKALIELNSKFPMNPNIKINLPGKDEETIEDGNELP